MDYVVYVGYALDFAVSPAVVPVRKLMIHETLELLVDGRVFD